MNTPREEEPLCWSIMAHIAGVNVTDRATTDGPQPEPRGRPAPSRLHGCRQLLAHSSGM